MSGEAASPEDRGLVVVAGGAGYLGAVLCSELLAAGYRVRALDRCFFGEAPLAPCREAGDRFELVRADVRDAAPEHFRDAWGAVDLAGLSNDPSCLLDEDLTHSINVEGGKALLRAARRAGVRRYLYQSSCSVYGSGGDSFLTEDSPTAPVSAYAESKLTLEEAALADGGSGFEVVISRMGTLYGLSPRMRFDLMINVMTLAAVEEGRIFVLGGGRQWRPLVHVRDAVRALRLLLEAPAERAAGRIYNVGVTAGNFRVASVARRVAREVGDTDLVQVPDDPDRRSYRVDFLRFEEAFDFEPGRGPEDGVREIVDALTRDEVETGPRARTVDYYRYLLEAKRVLDEVMLDGRLL